MAFQSPGQPGPQARRTKLPGKFHRRRNFQPPLPQGSQGTVFVPGGPGWPGPAARRPRWLLRIRQGHAFLPGWGQSYQGSPFPLYADQGGPRPARPPYRIPRGRSFMPVPPQQSQGVRFPLSVRRTGTRPRVLPRIRQGHAFLPVPPQSGSSPFQYYAVQPGARPRWAPPRRVSAGRVFLPGLGQQPQGARFPLFARQAGTRRLPPLPRAQRGRYSRVMRIPVTQQALAHWAAAGQMHATAFLARHAAMSPMTATGRMTIRGTRQAYATAAFHATGAMHASGVTVRPGTVHLTASGHMSASAAMVRVSRIRLTAAGTMRITGTVARRGAIAMHATGTMTVKGTRGQPAAAHWTAAGSMHAADGGPPPRGFSGPSRHHRGPSPPGQWH